MAVVRGGVISWLRTHFSLPERDELLAAVVAIILAGVAWYGLATIFPHNLMPYPQQTLALTWQLIASGQAWVELEATIVRTFIGFVGAILLGIAVGVIMGANEVGEKSATPYLLVGLTIPGIAWAAIFVIVFGLGFTAPTLATIVTVFPFIALYIWKGVESIDGDLLDMAKSFDASTPRTLRRIVLPNIAPSLFTAVRHGVAIAWKVETTAELFSSKHGVGAILIANYGTFHYARVWAWAFLFVIVLLILELGVLRPLEKITFDYREQADFRYLR